MYLKVFVESYCDYIFKSKKIFTIVKYKSGSGVTGTEIIFSIIAHKENSNLKNNLWQRPRGIKLKTKRKQTNTEQIQNYWSLDKNKKPHARVTPEGQ